LHNAFNIYMWALLPYYNITPSRFSGLYTVMRYYSQGKLKVPTKLLPDSTCNSVNNPLSNVRSYIGHCCSLTTWHHVGLLKVYLSAHVHNYYERVQYFDFQLTPRVQTGIHKKSSRTMFSRKHFPITIW